MIILILIILLFQNKFSNRLTNNGYLLLLLLLLLSTNDYNSNLNFSENIFFNPNRPNNNLNYNYHKNYSNRTPYNKDDYLKNYNKTPIKESYNKNNTCSCNEYYTKNQYYNDCIHDNYDKTNNERCISVAASDNCKSINTISCRNNLSSNKNEIESNTSNEHSSINSPSRPININSPIDKNTNNYKTIIPNNNINTTSTRKINDIISNNRITNNVTNSNISNSPSNHTHKISSKSTINFNNISQGQSITIILEGFGLISGKVLSYHDDVISLKLNNNKTIFINTNFISYFY